jgi:2-haloacid dehalogenase
VLAFDLYGTLVDPIAIADQLERVLDRADSAAVARAWRARQIDYTFRLTIMDRYRDFGWVTARSLDDALASLGLQLTAEARADLVAGYDQLPPFADVAPALTALRAAAPVLIVLSNGSPEMIDRCLRNAGLRAHFAAVVSADDVRAFKPAAAVYQHAAAEMGVETGAIRLVSSNPFDVIGAGTAGMKTAWCNRTGAAFDTIADPPELTVTDLGELSRVLTR